MAEKLQPNEGVKYHTKKLGTMAEIVLFIIIITVIITVIITNIILTRFTVDTSEAFTAHTDISICYINTCSIGAAWTTGTFINI